MSTSELLSTLRTLEGAKCEFIVVGGLAAVLNGAPIQTYDVDLVYSQTEENIKCLLDVLAELDAVFRQASASVWESATVQHHWIMRHRGRFANGCAPAIGIGLHASPQQFD